MRRPVYFSASISAGREDLPLYRRIVDRLKEEGHPVFAEHVASSELTAHGEELVAAEIFQRDLDWIGRVAMEGGVLVAEVSRPSLGVGYEIAAARYRFAMPVICLWRPKHTTRCSAMISGDYGIRLIEYADEATEGMLERLIGELR